MGTTKNDTTRHYVCSTKHEFYRRESCRGEIRQETRRSASKISAKYGDESVYFDLGDVESTTGSWEVYGVESTARYPDQQAKFFENAAQGLGRREAMYSFVALSSAGALLVWGGKGSKDAKLPITIGPQKE